ncbi:MAG: DUF4097 family beta strand repeat-containing protein [Candidatus Delongbacteria bacterium]|jgi:DUF4097 and DUF4098 domain-containing protein YvlB|nr:DUF4097 family beta strand repeat-containing protein [Candidatus Delongbacteria bacterium]
MKDTKIKYIIIILILLAAFKLASAAEIGKYSIGSMKDIDIYILKGANATKQITIKGIELNLNVVGVEEAKFEIFTSKKVSDLKTLLNSNKELKQTISLDTKYNADILIEKNKNELIVDLSKVKNGLLLVPKNISLVVDIVKGNADIEGVNGELVINGQQLDTKIKNVSAVINYKNKSGDISISAYEGVANLKTLQGDIKIINSSGKMNFKSAAGDININKFIGDIDINIQVGDIQISNSDDMSLKLNNKSGDFLLKNIKAKNIEINTASSDIAIFDVIAKSIQINNQSGDVLLKKVKSDLDIDINSGDLMLKNFEPLFKKNSRIGVNFGDVNIELKDPNLFKYFQSVNENELTFDKSIKLNKDLKICTKDKKCIVISLNYGQISVEKIK